EYDVALLCGAEAVFTRTLARKTGAHLPWTRQPADTAPSDLIGDARSGACDAEMSRSLVLPSQIYPVFENALWAAGDRTADEHQAMISELWSRFSSVAAGNPQAWTPSAMS